MNNLAGYALLRGVQGLIGFILSYLKKRFKELFPVWKEFLFCCEIICSLELLLLRFQEKGLVLFPVLLLVLLDHNQD